MTYRRHFAYDRWTMNVNCPVTNCLGRPGHKCTASLVERFPMPYPHYERGYYGRMQRLKDEKAKLDVPDLDS